MATDDASGRAGGIQQDAIECRTRPQANPIGLASVIRTLQSVHFAESTSTRILPAVMPYRGVTVTVLVVSESPTKEFVMKY